MTTYVLPIFIILLLIVLNGLFVAAEFAIVAARKSRLQQLASTGNAGAGRVAAVLASSQTQDRYIAVSQLGITLASVGLGMYGEKSIAEWLLEPLHQLGASDALAHTIALIIAVAALTYLHVVIGEMIPKALALQRPEATSLQVIGPMTLFGTLLRPLVWALTGIGNALLQLIGVPLSGHGRSYTALELEQLVDESAEEGVVADMQHELIDNIFTFGERSVDQLMTHRTRVVGLDISDPPEKITALLQDTGYSRFPVYRGDLDHVVGILHVRDYIRLQAEGASSAELSTLLRRAPRVPENLLAESLLESFKRLKIHMAVVMNEYGGTAGIVTLEDLLEEVVGEVQDEYDASPDTASIRELEPGILLVEGETLLTQLNRNYALDLPLEPSDTVAGLVVDALGRTAAVGDEVGAQGVTFKVEAVEGLAVRQVRLTLPERPASKAATQAPR